MSDEFDIRNRIVEFRKVRLGDVAHNPRNWRDHPDNQRESFRGVTRQIGWAGVPLVYNSERTGTLTYVDGHMRKEELPDLEAEVAVTDLNDEEADLMLATYDPIGAAAVANREKLGALLQGVRTDNAAVQAMLAGLAEREGVYFGGNGKPPEDPGPQVDRAAELQEKWQVQTGDLWVIPSKTADGEHRVICGDCTDAAVVERVMGGEKAHMIFTDPPYGVDYDGGAKKREKLSGDEVGTEIYSLALPILASYADGNAPLYLWYADGHAAAAAAAAAGYQITAQIIWAKNQAQFVTSAHYKGKHEPCYYAHKKGKSARWYGPNNEVTLWEYDRSPRNDFHPTQKPVELAERAIRNSSDTRQVVIDGFLGGGTTMVAAERLGRFCRGIEIEPKYVSVTLERLADLGLSPQRID